MKFILIIIAMVVISLAVLGVKHYLISQRQRKNYLAIQSGRPPMSPADFCRQAGLDLAVVPIVVAVRSSLAKYGKCDECRIHPDDAFYPHFGPIYEDTAAWLVQEMKVIDGFCDYDFPLEAVETVADFVKVISRLKEEADKIGREDNR